VSQRHRTDSQRAGTDVRVGMEAGRPLQFGHPLRGEPRSLYGLRLLLWQHKRIGLSSKYKLYG